MTKTGTGKIRVLISAMIISVLIFSYATVAEADPETITFPATLLSGFYKNEEKGVDGFIVDEGTRALTTICAYLDWYAYDNKADCLMNHTYIGKDKDGILYIGLGGKDSSIVMMYYPDTNPDNYVAVKIEMGGSWIPSFLELYCEPLYQNSETVMNTTIQGLKNLANN